MLAKCSVPAKCLIAIKNETMYFPPLVAGKTYRTSGQPPSAAPRPGSHRLYQHNDNLSFSTSCFPHPSLRFHILKLHRPHPCSPKSPTMCEYTKNYYIYTTCLDPGTHFFRTSIDGSRKTACPRGPHERYIVQPGQCPLCG
ncbi:hypothetical protein F5B21DRAFT_445872 [Xylaria acuta]|nr:hypothetical protein F5B21DRAFT_445872 [Xylaria acuta]